MKKKVIILSMSCNKERYINEEKVIRETWGKDIIEGKYDNIELLFYRGGTDKTYLENDILHLISDDTLIGTYQKSIDCFEWLIKNKEFDYVIRTNTSTYINVEAILRCLDFNINEDIVCGPYLLMNRTNNFIPFLPGFYLIFSKKIINLLVNKRLLINNYDDNTFAITLLNSYGRNYLEEHILEIDNINFDDIDKVNLSNVYCVRVKDEENKLNTIDNMKIIHEKYMKLKNIDIKQPHGFTKVYTFFGKIPININE